MTIAETAKTTKSIPSRIPNSHMSIAAAPKATKANKVAKPADHPKYSVMIAIVITTLKNRNGSSGAAILKYIVANNKVDTA